MDGEGRKWEGMEKGGGESRDREGRGREEMAG